MRGKVSINLLEFIASTIILILSLEGTKKNRKIFAPTNNSSALGWFYQASFHQAEKNSHNKVARYIERYMIKSEHSIYAEHIKGSSNNVADMLSREFYHSKMNQQTFLMLTLMTRCHLISKFRTFQQSYSHDYIAHGKFDNQKGVKKKFSQKTNTYWRKWIKFCNKPGSKMNSSETT